jgi:hypothetical protein
MVQSPGRIVAATLSAWFCFALAIGFGGFFRGATAPMVALTVWVLTAVALLACWKISLFKSWAAMVELRVLVALHLMRFVGIYFLILGQRGALPIGFARPAGIGDVIVASAAVALLVATKTCAARPSYQKALLLWNLFGCIDIVFVVFSALRSGLQDWQSMVALRQLPLSLLPTFFVPLIITSHVLIFVRLRRG